jgi:hypothetical protein
MREGVVGKGISREYQELSPEDQRKFDGWLKANAILGSILASALLATALAGLYSSPPNGATEFSSVNVSSK